MTGNPKNNRLFFVLWFIVAIFIITGCAPKRSYSPAKDETNFKPPTLQPTYTPTVPTPTPSAKLTEEADCDPILSYLEDVTIPDDTQVEPGATLDKRWRVENSGTCNWDKGYTIQFVDGNAMGATTTQALYPALANTEAEIRIVFTAPMKSGSYISEWQAVNPEGKKFGDPIFIVIEVVDSTEAESTPTPESNP